MANESKVNEKFSIMKKTIEDMGGTITDFIPERSSYSVKLNGKDLLLEHHIAIPRTLSTTVIATKCKDVTYKLLKQRGLPTPTTAGFYRRSYNKKKALAKLNELKYPIIIKDATGSNSLGIVLDVQSPKKANAIVKKKLRRFGSIIAQEMVYGREYRVLVLNDKVIAALEMIHPHVIGDGESKIKSLIKTMQKDTKRRTKFNKDLKKILLGQKVTLSSIPKKGKIIYIKRNSALAEGGQTKDVTDDVHPEIKKICIKASIAVEKRLIGIDVMCNDISKAPTSKNFNLLEINGKPDIYIHYNPTHGKTRDVLKKVLKFITTSTSEIKKQS